MSRILLVSLLLHAVALLALATWRDNPVAAAIDPPRIEILFGHESAPTPPAAALPTAAVPTIARADPPAPLATDGEGPRARPPGALDPTRPAAALQLPSAQDTAGLRVDEPDPTMIPARDDPGNAAPPYPDDARRNHIEGTVLLRLHITETGRVAWLETLQSSGDASLDDAAETTLAHWHFLPARRDGVPVPSYRDQPVRFAIE